MASVATTRERKQAAKPWVQAELREYARPHRHMYEDRVGHPANRDVDAFVWRFEPRFRVDRPIDRSSPAERAAWMREEMRMWADEGQPDRYDGMLRGPIEDPVVAVVVGGEAFLWDGNHRVGARVLMGKKTIPAVVGRPPVVRGR